MDLQKKRADLVAQVEQFVGQINRNNGAIALIDDLIAEEAAAEATAPAPPIAQTTTEPLSAAPDWVQPPVKDMLPAQPEDVA